MTRLGSLIGSGIIGIGKGFKQVNEAEDRKAQLNQLSYEIWQQLSINHNSWSGIEKNVLTQHQLNDEEMSELKMMVKYHFEQTKQAMAGLD